MEKISQKLTWWEGEKKRKGRKCSVRDQFKGAVEEIKKYLLGLGGRRKDRSHKNWEKRKDLRLD